MPNGGRPLHINVFSSETRDLVYYKKLDTLENRARIPEDSRLRFMSDVDADVLIIGAGLSGIDAAHHLRKKRPTKTFIILENRASIGGTWDLFRYPGVRSDSDMLTMSIGG